MAVAQTKLKKKKSRDDSQVVSDATRRLLQGIKKHAKANGKTLDRAALIKQGYSLELLDQLEAA